MACNDSWRRQVTSGVAAARSLIPRKPGERIKTGRRDAINLAKLHRAKLHRAGELMPVN